jgi:superfamily I DNA and RNA helicase
MPCWSAKEHRLIAFLFRDDPPSLSDDDGWASLKDEQDRLYYAIDANLSRHDTLRDYRRLAVEVEPIVLFPVAPNRSDAVKDRLAGLDNIAQVISDCPPIDKQYLRPLQSALQRVTTIKPHKKRENVTRPSSRGGILKEIEKGIANLDQWQKRAAIETPDGPQRIRGLAGSGKTVVLALKAAYLHSQHPEWNIAVTFHTLSLHQQIKDLIRRFSFEHLNDEPDWRHLRVMHSWGGRERDGLYTEIARHVDVVPRDFLHGKTRYGMNGAFQGICAELLAATNGHAVEPLYDAVLIDEAQDLPPELFQLVYRFASDPKRIVWAYDELQTLSESVMPATNELFGQDQAGHPLVTLNNVEGRPRQDIILPVCYRNTPWSLTLAHGLGFGVYRRPKPVQHFDDPALWREIGYQVVDGQLEPGEQVTIERNPNSYPDYFPNLLEPDDAVVSRRFDHSVEQAEWIARRIKTNLTHDELESDDILVVLPIALTAKNDATELATAMQRYGIRSHLAGVVTSRDKIFVKGSVAMANIYRSKGNEAPMVYLVNAQSCHDPVHG